MPNPRRYIADAEVPGHAPVEIPQLWRDRTTRLAMPALLWVVRCNDTLVADLAVPSLLRGLIVFPRVAMAEVPTPGADRIESAHQGSLRLVELVHGR